MITDQTCCPTTTCSLCAGCLRHRNYQKAMSQCDSFHILNTSMMNPKDDYCAYCLVPAQERLAYGFTKMWQSVPVGVARSMSYGVRFGSEATFYRSKRGERPLCPTEQAAILEAVAKYGGDASIGFDRYEDHTIYVNPSFAELTNIV